MTGQAIVAKLTNITEIPGADNIVQAKLFGEVVIIGKQNVEGELGVLFDCETQLSEDFCKNNNMYNKPELNANKEVKGYISSDRRIRAIRLKGIKCSALWLPISALSYTGEVNNLTVGLQFNAINGVEVCKKFVRTRPGFTGKHSQGTMVKFDMVPTFKEHVDTLLCRAA